MSELQDDIVIVPIEIRPGLTVKIALPANITAAEAERVAAVVVAYASGAPKLEPSE